VRTSQKSLKLLHVLAWCLLSLIPTPRPTVVLDPDIHPTPLFSLVFWVFETRKWRYICKKLALSTQRNDDWIYRDEVAPITYDNGDTIFGNEVQPKPTSPGHDYGRNSPNRNTGRSRSWQYAVFPCEPVAMSSWLQQQPPSHIYEEARVTEYDTHSTLYC
jgi:hypothetical protein